MGDVFIYSNPCVSCHYMNRRCTVLLLFVLTQTIVHAQEVNKKTSHRRQIKTLMKEQIKQLKDGVLLVRLQTKENSITALIKINQDELAAKIRVKQLNKNKKIVSAFRDNFTFCPAYFFFSNYSDNILSKQINEIIFLNDSLQPDSSIKLTSRKFLTAEFGLIKQDTAKYFSNYYYYSGDIGIERRSAYYGEPDMRFEVLKIMSDQLVQLIRPFPYYVRTFSALPIIKRKLSKVVMRMNKKLFRYYEKNNGS